MAVFNDKLWMNACATGDMDYIRTIFKDVPHTSLVAGFEHACQHNQLEVAQFVFASSSTPIVIDPIEYLYYCEDSTLPLAQWLFVSTREHHYRITHPIGSDVFTHCCTKGDINTIKWLFSIAVDKCSLAVANKSIYNACIGHHLELVKWLHSTFCTVQGIDFAPRRSYPEDVKEWLTYSMHEDESLAAT